ncbi:hypothetical protein MMC14_001708 [Varicellaria rhodocarpa]|nr:hypothetical protein [Varicellaria rhodocarpa]
MSAYATDSEYEERLPFVFWCKKKQDLAWDTTAVFLFDTHFQEYKKCSSKTLEGLYEKWKRPGYPKDEVYCVYKISIFKTGPLCADYFYEGLASKSEEWNTEVAAYTPSEVKTISVLVKEGLAFFDIDRFLREEFPKGKSKFYPSRLEKAFGAWGSKGNESHQYTAGRTQDPYHITNLNTL